MIKCRQKVNQIKFIIIFSDSSYPFFWRRINEADFNYVATCLDHIRVSTFTSLPKHFMQEALINSGVKVLYLSKSQRSRRVTKSKHE